MNRVIPPCVHPPSYSESVPTLDQNEGVPKQDVAGSSQDKFKNECGFRKALIKEILFRATPFWGTVVSGSLQWSESLGDPGHEQLGRNRDPVHPLSYVFIYIYIYIYIYVYIHIYTYRERARYRYRYRYRVGHLQDLGNSSKTDKRQRRTPKTMHLPAQLRPKTQGQVQGRLPEGRAG